MNTDRLQKIADLIKEEGHANQAEAQKAIQNENFDIAKKHIDNVNMLVAIMSLFVAYIDKNSN